MIQNAIRIFIVVVIILAFLTPVYLSVKKINERQQMSKKEKALIGSVNVYNQRVLEIQETLSGLQLYTGPVDGKMGLKTRKALRAFQAKKELKATGLIDTSTYAELNRQKFDSRKDRKTGQGSNLSKASGPGSHDASRQLAEKMKQAKSLKPAANSPDEVRKIQIALKKSGYYKGHIDGKLGDQTKSAIKNFQMAKNLKADGVVGPRTWDELKKSLSNPLHDTY